MGKATYKGLVPRDDPMFSGGVEIFSRLGSSKSSTTSAPSTAGATQAPSTLPTSSNPARVKTQQELAEGYANMTTAQLAKLFDALM